MKYLALAVVLGIWIGWEYRQYQIRKRRALMQRIIRMSPPAKLERDASVPSLGGDR